MINDLCSRLLGIRSALHCFRRRDCPGDRSGGEVFSHAALEGRVPSFYQYLCSDIPYGVKLSFLHQLQIDLM